MVQNAQSLPTDLDAHGWKQVRQESTVHRLQDAEWYAVVYMRPFDPDIDDENSSQVVRMNRRMYVRISTNAARSVSWGAAHTDAIGLMRAADNRTDVAPMV